MGRENQPVTSTWHERAVHGAPYGSGYCAGRLSQTTGVNWMISTQ